MQNNLRFNFSKYDCTLSSAYEQRIVPSNFSSNLTDIFSLYIASLINKPVNLPNELNDILNVYQKMNKFPENINSISLLREKMVGVKELSEEKHIVFLTGGKDSVHLVLEVIKAYGKENVMAVYVSGVNKSETFYEKKAVENISKIIGIPFRIVNLKIKIKNWNREGHFIGLRNQLVIGLSLPYFFEFGAGNAWFGIHKNTTEPKLWTDNTDVLDDFCRYLSTVGANIKVRTHREFTHTNENEITRHLFLNHKNVFNQISSCYAQINWREQMHERIKKKLPSFPLANGCGYCVKCLRINAVIYNEVKLTLPMTERMDAVEHFYGTFKKKFPKDDTLTKIWKIIKNENI